MSSDPHPTTADLLRFIDASPTPFHCVAETARRLDAAGFEALDEAAPWKIGAGGRYYVARAGAVVAFAVGSGAITDAGFRVIGAHTDSPGFRVKPLAEVKRERCLQVGLEVYGGPLLYTWLDRDLGLAGRVALRAEGERTGVDVRLIHIPRPLLRIPTLAVHLDRESAAKGLKLDKQKHLPALLGLDGEGAQKGGAGPFVSLLANELDVDPQRIASWELGLVDLAPSVIGGLSGELIFAPRLDNQGMCHAGLTALLRALETAKPEATAVISLYDHEEVGSNTVTGAAGPMTARILRRLAELEGPGATPGGLERASARSFQVSADMAHAVHPNFSDRHEPQHQPRLNGGPVIKVNALQRYASSAEGEGIFALLCQDEGVPYQKFVNRTDLPCGSTIGPISSTLLGITSVDVGNAMLSMHSVRELAGAADPEPMTAVMTRFLTADLAF